MKQLLVATLLIGLAACSGTGTGTNPMAPAGQSLSLSDGKQLTPQSTKAISAATSFTVLQSWQFTATSTTTYTSHGAYCVAIPAAYDPDLGPILAAVYNQTTHAIYPNVAGSGVINHSTRQVCFAAGPLPSPILLTTGDVYYIALYQQDHQQ